MDMVVRRGRRDRACAAEGAALHEHAVTIGVWLVAQYVPNLKASEGVQAAGACLPRSQRTRPCACASALSVSFTIRDWVEDQ